MPIPAITPISPPSPGIRRETAAAAAADGPPKRVQAGDAWIEYRIRRSDRRRKTYQIAVRSGEVVVAVPHRTTNRQAEDMVLQKAQWILSKLAVEEREPDTLRFLSGEKLPYCGRDLTLWVEGVAETANGKPRVSLDRRRLRVSVPMSITDEVRQRHIGDALVEWYAQRASDQIWEQVHRWWPALGRGESPAVHVRNQKRRWGSCSHDGVLRFNWRLAMLDPSLTEYVVVHELAHLTHMNHSRSFWDLVEQHLPDVKERRRWLREAGAELPQL